MPKNRTSNRGGYRQPEKPAVSSGPGALSGRTDGGPGSKNQPLRRLPDADHGANKAFYEQQQAAPLPVAESPNVFAPTERPMEPITEGVPIGQGGGPTSMPTVDNTDMMLQAAYQISASPGLLRLMDYRKRRT